MTDKPTLLLEYKPRKPKAKARGMGEAGATTDKQALLQEHKARKIEAKGMAREMSEAGPLTWLWSLLFGPIYFAVHGFWGAAIVLFLLSLALFPVMLFWIPWLASPFVAYAAWRKRGAKEAEALLRAKS